MAASSIMLLMPAAPRPPSQNEMYWKPTLTSLRRPSSVISPGVDAASSSCVGRDVDVVALAVDLVRLVAEHRVERLGRHLHDVRVRDPGAVEAGLGLALLVLADGLDRPLVRLGVLARRDQRGHAAHRERAARVAGLDQQLRVGAHERHGHLHVGAVREHELRVVPEALDHREDVVPAAGVEPVRVVAQLVQDLVHLERGRAASRSGRSRGSCRVGTPSASSVKLNTSFHSRASRWCSIFGR